MRARRRAIRVARQAKNGAPAVSARYAARPLAAPGGRTAVWGVYQETAFGRAGRVSLFAGYSGSFAWWRAHWQAAALNRAMGRGR